MASDDDLPKPGSDAAVARGCECPVLDNARGQGMPSASGPRYWITDGCPMHAPEVPYGE